MTETTRIRTLTEVIDLKKGICITGITIGEKDNWFLHQKGKEPKPYPSYFTAKNAALKLQGYPCTNPKS